jgi:hypothetical protein
MTPGATTEKRISSRLMTWFSAQLKNSAAILTNAPTIFPKAPETVMMSWKVRELIVSMILRGMDRANASRPESAPWN